MADVDSSASSPVLRIAVLGSFWAGGVGLAILKAIAYASSGSVLVRSSMFESLGDVASTSIMWLTQQKMADTRDNHLYPVGKGRLTALGIFFFSAFMCSAFTSVAIEALQTIFSGADDEGTPASAVALRRLLTEHSPIVRRLLGSRRIDQLVSDYSSPIDSEEEDAAAHTVTLILILCCCVKVALLILCRYAGKRVNKSSAEMVHALATDHCNDVMTITLILVASAVVDRLRANGHAWPWLSLVDPVASLLLAAWIIYGWLSTAAEQVQVLSDRVADTVNEEPLLAAATDALSDSPFQVVKVQAHHIGEGVCVRIGVRLQDTAGGAADVLGKDIPKLLLKAKETMQKANEDVREVHIELCADAAVGGQPQGRGAILVSAKEPPESA